MQDFVSFPLSDVFPATKNSPSPNLLVLDTTFSPPLPLPLKLGDVNQDGFPDLVAIIASGSGSQASYSPRVVLSMSCAKGVAGCDAHGAGKRGWSVLKKNVEPLERIVDARSVAFLDMDEDVCLV